jgi:hypothetical protein
MGETLMNHQNLLLIFFLQEIERAASQDVVLRPGLQIWITPKVGKGVVLLRRRIWEFCAVAITALKRTADGNLRAIVMVPARGPPRKTKNTSCLPEIPKKPFSGLLVPMHRRIFVSMHGEICGSRQTQKYRFKQYFSNDLVAN